MRGQVHFIASLIAIAMLPSLACAEDQSLEPYSLRGVALGSTLEEFRAFPPVSDGMWIDPTVVCDRSGDRDLSPNDVSAGVRRCFWEAEPEVPPQMKMRMARRPMPMNIGNGGAAPTFDFISDGKGNYRLFRIILDTGSTEWEKIYPAFVQKFGQPVLSASTVENAYGASFGQIEATWSNGVSSIAISKRCFGRLDRMCVGYFHGDLFARYEASVQAADQGATRL